MSEFSNTGNGLDVFEFSNTCSQLVDWLYWIRCVSGCSDSMHLFKCVVGYILENQCTGLDIRVGV